MCPAKMKRTASAKWWCAVSLSQRLPVIGFKPPLKVKKSEYSLQLRVKNGNRPLLKLGNN